MKRKGIQASLSLISSSRQSHALSTTEEEYLALENDEELA